MVGDSALKDKPTCRGPMAYLACLKRHETEVVAVAQWQVQQHFQSTLVSVVLAEPHHSDLMSLEAQSRRGPWWHSMREEMYTGAHNSHQRGISHSHGSRSLRHIENTTQERNMSTA